MIRLLPFIIIPILILGGLGYWRYIASQNSLTSPQENKAVQSQSKPLEIPKTLPQASLEDRVKATEDMVSKLVIEINKLKLPNLQTSSTDPQVSSLDAQVTELKARVSALEKTTPTSQTGSSTQSTIYIPLGSGGSSRENSYVTMPTYEVTVNPSEYPGYKNMQLEVNMRLNDPNGLAYARLYNFTDSTLVVEVSTASTAFIWLSSSTFTLPSGSKKFILQLKSTEVKDIFIQNARIKVTY